MHKSLTLLTMSVTVTEQSACKKAKKKGWNNIKIERRTGYPDRLFWKEGRYVWIEVKRPGNDEPTKKQQEKIDDLVKQGCMTAICWSEEQCLKILTACDESMTPLKGFYVPDFFPGYGPPDVA